MASRPMGGVIQTPEDAAKARLVDVADDIRMNRFDEADTTLRDLESTYQTLPQAIQDQIKDLRKMIEGEGSRKK